MSTHGTYTKEEQAENRRKWVAALRSGEYPQTQGILRDSDGYCCLGVACELARYEGLVAREGAVYRAGDSGYYAVLPGVVQDWLGLADNEGGLVDGTEGYWYNLTSLNDDALYTFDQIANVIEFGGVRLVGGSDE